MFPFFGGNPIANRQSPIANSAKSFLQRHELLIIFLLGMALLMPCIWRETSITGQDEYWLSFRTPMETLAKDAWFTPWVNGEPRLKKPPLLYWSMILSYKTLGINLFAARIWGVLAGAGLAVCATLLYRELFKKSGLLAGLITLGTISVAIEGRRAMLDLPLAFFTALAVCLALRWGISGKAKWLLLAAVSLGLSFLVKGPVGIILFGVAAVGALVTYKRWPFLRDHLPHVFWGAVLVCIISLHWPLIMAYLWPGFVQVMNSEVGARGIGTFHLGDALSTLGEGLGLVFPWSLILVAALMASGWHWKEYERRHERWLSVWFFGCVVPFMFIHSFARYMTPLIPAAAVLCARWLENRDDSLKHFLLCVSMGLMTLVSAAFALFFIWFKIGVFMAFLTLLAALLLLWMTFKKRSPRLIAGTVAILFTCIMGGLYPTLGINAMPAGIDEVIGTKPVAAFNSSQPSMLSMRLKRSAIRIRNAVPRDMDMLTHLDGFVFVRASDTNAFEALARKLGIRFRKAGQFKTFYSRQAWIRFAREDATARDWKTAIEQRSLQGLKATITYYRVSSAPEVSGETRSVTTER